MASPAAKGLDYDDVWTTAYGDIQDRGPVHRHMRRLVARVLDGLRYQSVLDVGCGAGHNLPVLCAGRTVRRVTGVDVSGEALRRARTRSTAEFRELDIETGALDGTWDLVFCSLVLEHLEHDEDALTNMRAMCGRDLVLSTIAGNFERYRPWEVQMGHVRNYERGELEAKLRMAGFEPQLTTYWGFPFYSPIGRRLQNRMTSKTEFSPLERAIAWIAHNVYYLNSARRGDLLIVHATAR